MGNDTLTATGVTGPGVALTTTVFNYVTDLDFQIARGVLKVTHQKGITDVELSTITTITYTIATGVATVTIS